MAGDWIKIEVTTPDKPEVILMAETLKMEADSVVGKLIRIWVWADLNTVDGNAVTVTDAFLDRLTHKKGFARAMRRCGWLNGKDGELTFPGFERHNGSTAKARAQTNRRVAKFRNGNADETPAALTKALPEKSREEKKATVPPREALAEHLCLAHPARARTGPALSAALQALKRHDYETVLAGTVAYANAVAGWTENERIQFVTNPERFFMEDTWNQPAENWRSKTAARKESNGRPVMQALDLGKRKPTAILTLES